jgi:hypothetical protein
MEMHDMGKRIEKQKHGRKSLGEKCNRNGDHKGKGEDMNSRSANDYELIFVRKKKKKNAKVVEDQTM